MRQWFISCAFFCLIFRQIIRFLFMRWRRLTNVLVNYFETFKPQKIIYAESGRSHFTNPFVANNSDFQLLNNNCVCWCNVNEKWATLIKFRFCTGFSSGWNVLVRYMEHWTVSLRLLNPVQNPKMSVAHFSSYSFVTPGGRSPMLSNSLVYNLTKMLERITSHNRHTFMVFYGESNDYSRLLTQ